MLSKFFKKQIIRFIVCGLFTAAFNILIINIIIEFFNIDKPIFRNIANVITIEISLLFSFVVYRNWVWSKGNWTLQEVVWRQIPLYHLSCASIVATRSLILFPVLDWLGINYSINTLLGILVGSFINYFMSDRLVFKDK
ncbi:GtrA family protein [Nostoc linckia FACHB-391]|uniref:GtrA family protein n=3 Tax=Nostoc TaxID=1177 RepID=A0ABR8I732_9NOSO|nr:GtrA family protein [Nostoc linckia FACHB-391]MBD2647225.1 GtrA family protein [Nostoc foliaceum FACHB-393]